MPREEKEIYLCGVCGFSSGLDKGVMEIKKNELFYSTTVITSYHCTCISKSVTASLERNVYVPCR